MIETTGEGKSAVATPDGKKPKEEEVNCFYYLGAKTEYMCLNGTPLGSVKIQSAQLPHLYRIQISGKQSVERWRYECRSKQEDTVWME